MLNFRFFNMENENLGFLARRQNVAQSTVLREYLFKIPKLFQIGPIVIKNEPSKVGRKSKNHHILRLIKTDFYTKSDIILGV